MNGDKNDAASEVTIGQDGWLFLTGGSNEPLKMYNDPDWFSTEKAEAWGELLARRRSRALRLGVRYAHVPVPEKATVYSDKFPLPIPFMGRAPTRYLPRFFKNDERHRDAWASWIDILPFFISQKDSGLDIYWKTDTHWNFAGAFSAYQMICAFLDTAPRMEILQRPRTTGKLNLDLGAKLKPPVEEIFEVVDVLNSSKIVFKNELVNLKEKYNIENDGGYHHGSEVIFKNDAPGVDKRRVLLFGDSFSEYRPHLLTGLLAETFSEVRFIWSASIDWSIVERYAPDLLLTELAERFMRIVPGDDYDHEQVSAQKAENLKKAMSERSQEGM